MLTQTKPRFSSKELSSNITEHIQELAEATDLAHMSEAMLSYLNMCSRFHRYSANNIWLIMMAKPAATFVAGYSKWRSMGRYVMEGEKGIPILAPVLVRIENEEDEEEEMLVGFKVVYVYDVSQTEGEPLPEPPNWKSPEQNAVLQAKLLQFAESRDIKVIVDELFGDIQGKSSGGKIVISPDAGSKTIIHEIAHELLHQGEDRSFDKTILELEAESVAYVVGRHFGLAGVGSPNYVALHGANANMIMANMDRIRNTATVIIKAIDERADDIH